MGDDQQPGKPRRTNPLRHESSLVAPVLLRGSIYVAGAGIGVLVARSLGPHDRGLWSVALVWAGTVALVAELGIAAAVLHQSRAKPARRAATAASGLLAAAVSSTVLAAAAIVVAAWIPSSVPFSILGPALAVVPAVNVTTVVRQILLERGSARAAMLALSIQSWSLLALLGGVEVFASLSLQVAIWTYAVSVCLGLGYAARAVIFALPRSLRFDGISPALVRFGLATHVGTVALFLVYRGDLLLVQQFCGPSSAGVYAVALSLSEILRLVPELSQMVIVARSRNVDILTVARQTTGLAVCATLSLGAAAVLAARRVVVLVFGPSFADAAEVFAALVPGIAGLAASYSISPVLLIGGRPGVSTMASCLGLGLMVALDWITVPRFGIVAAAWVSSAVYWAIALVQWAAIRQSHSFPIRDLVLPRKASTAAGCCPRPEA